MYARRYFISQTLVIAKDTCRGKNVSKDVYEAINTKINNNHIAVKSTFRISCPSHHLEFKKVYNWVIYLDTKTEG